VPVAVNCWVRPAATDGAAGVTAIEVREGDGAGGGVLEPELPPHADIMDRTVRADRQERKRRIRAGAGVDTGFPQSELAADLKK
jgi:hypothetical protein